MHHTRQDKTTSLALQSQLKSRLHLTSLEVKKLSIDRRTWNDQNSIIIPRRQLERKLKLFSGPGMQIRGESLGSLK